MTKFPPQIRRVLISGTSTHALSWPTFSITAAISVIVHIFGSVDLDYEFLWFRIPFAIFSTIPMFCVIWIANKIPVPDSQKPYWMLTSYLIGGLSRGLSLHLMLNASGILGSWSDQSRVFASALSMGTTVFIVTQTRSYFRKYSESVSDLLKENEYLADALRSLERKFTKTSRRQVSHVKQEVFKELKRIELIPIERQSLRIQEIIDQHVKPLSKAYASSIQTWIPVERLVKRPSFFTSWRSMNPALALPSPWYALTLLSVAPMPTAYSQFGGLRSLEIGVFIFIAMAPSVTYGFALARRALPRFTRPWRELLFTLLMLVISLPGALATIVALLGTSDPTAYVFGGLVIFPMYTWLLAIGGSYIAELRNQEEELLVVRNKLRHAKARLNLLAWYDQGLISRLLHGPIQNSMHATAIRMKGQKNETLIESLISDLKKRISKSVAQAKDSGGDGLNITDSLRDTSDLWSGIAKVKILADASSITTLGNDAPMNAIVVDLCNEICSNSIRHGRATNLKIALTQELNLIRVHAEDNSTQSLQMKSHGLGSKFLDNCSTDWNVIRKGNRNVLDVFLPC